MCFWFVQCLKECLRVLVLVSVAFTCLRVLVLVSDVFTCLRVVFTCVLVLVSDVYLCFLARLIQ